ncbi:MAG: hypothetical protein M0042_08935 [Nitrospiraceae bacterium]|nr:hypothetical protein [Nitrospiraceae bacterium]
MPSFRDISIKAVLAGFAADIVATLGISFLLVSAMVANDIPEAEIGLRMKTLSGLLLSLIVGLCCTGTGAYIAGRIAKSQEMFHGIIVSLLGMALGLFFTETGIPLWYDIASYVLILPAGAAGGYLALLRRKEPS